MRIRSVSIAAIIAIGLAGCGGGSGSSTIPVGAAPQSPNAAAKKIAAYNVQLTPATMVTIINADSVVTHGNSVTVQYSSGSTKTFQGSSPTVTRVEGTYTDSVPTKVTQGRLPGSCPPQYDIQMYGQTTSFIEGQGTLPLGTQDPLAIAAGGGDYAYSLDWAIPAASVNVGGLQTSTWSGNYSAGGTFNYTFGPYGASAPSNGWYVDGGPTRDYIGQSSMQYNYTDDNGYSWFAQGVKSLKRCPL